MNSFIYCLLVVICLIIAKKSKDFFVKLVMTAVILGATLLFTLSSLSNFFNKFMIFNI